MKKTITMFAVIFAVAVFGYANMNQQAIDNSAIQTLKLAQAQNIQPLDNSNTQEQNQMQNENNDSSNSVNTPEHDTDSSKPSDNNTDNSNNNTDNSSNTNSAPDTSPQS